MRRQGGGGGSSVEQDIMCCFGVRGMYFKPFLSIPKYNLQALQIHTFKLNANLICREEREEEEEDEVETDEKDIL